MPARRPNPTPFLDARTLGVMPGGTGVQTALNEGIAALSAQDGGTLFLPPGEYGVGGSIVMRAGVELFGPGAVVTADASMGAVPMVGLPDFLGGHDDIAVTGVTLDGNKANRTSVHPNSQGIAFIGAVATPNERVAVRRCIVREQPGISVAIQNALYWWAQDNYVVNGSRDGINSAGFTQHGFVTNNVVRGCMDDGVALNSEFLGSSVLRIVVSGNSIFYDRDKESWETYFGSGIMVRGGGHVRVVNNSVDAAFASGIGLETTPFQTLGNVLVQGNQITDTGKRATTDIGHGILLDIGAVTVSSHSGTVDRVHILGNAVRGSRFTGIMTTATSGSTMTNVRIESNDVDGSGSTTVSRPAGGRGIHVAANFGCSDLRVRHNTVRNNPSWGIDIGDGTQLVTRLRVEGNDVVNNNTAATANVGGIRVRRAAGTTHLQDNVSKNTSGSNQSHGFVSANCAGVGFSHSNDFSGNSTANVSIATDTTTWTPGAPA